MLIKTFTLRFSPNLDGFDDEPVRSFMADKSIASVKEHFFIKDNIPYLTFVITYSAAPLPADAQTTKTTSDNRKDNYRKLLNEQNTPLFNQLREWRKNRSMKDSVPPYVLFTNYQLANIAAKAPTSLQQLSAIEGVGKAKLEKYGKDIIGIIQRFPTRTADPNQKTEKTTESTAGNISPEASPSPEKPDSKGELWDSLPQKEGTKPHEP